MKIRSATVTTWLLEDDEGNVLVETRACTQLQVVNCGSLTLYPEGARALAHVLELAAMVAEGTATPDGEAGDAAEGIEVAGLGERI